MRETIENLNHVHVSVASWSKFEGLRRINKEGEYTALMVYTCIPRDANTGGDYSAPLHTKLSVLQTRSLGHRP